MTAATREELMPRTKGRPKKPGGEGIPVRIDPDLVTKARYIVANRGLALSDFVSSLLRPLIEREFRKEAKGLIEEDK